MKRRAALALLALCTLLRIVSLFRPCLSDDEATYAVVGREMLHGQVLYRDVVDHKPPAIYATNEVAQALGGQLVLHLLLIVVVWATGLLLARIVRRHGDPRAAIFAAVLWSVFSTTLVDVDALAANCELFMMLPLVASVVVFRDDRPLLAGVLVGVAALYKYQAGIQLPLYAGAWIWKYRSRSIPGLIAIGVGFAIPIALAALWLARAGGLDAALFWFKFNFGYIDAGSSKSEMIVRALVRGGFAIGAALLLYVSGAIAVARRRWSFDVAWLAASVAAVLVGGRFFGHYFHQVTAPLAVLAAPIAMSLWEKRRALLIAGCAIPACAFLVLGAIHDQMMRWAGEPDPDYGQVVAWLDAHSTRADSLCIWGNSPVLYFEADRPLGCRFVFANYLTGLSPATATQSDPNVDSSANIVPEAWDMLEHDLADRRPRWMIDASPGDVGHYGKYAPDRFARLARVLACDYRPVADVIGMRIFERLSSSRCPAITRQPM
ncbi:MAG TPA: hypothetical protein VL463_32305 [Kofleriaceae bacterium]|nr:hypothetical protein [Kofleriaceae bacterium]